MPRVVHNRLTVRRVAAIDAPGMYADGLGLYLQVNATGHKSWVLRYTINGRRRDMGLGSVRVVGLAEARLAAQAAQALIRQQIDPIDERNRRLAVAAPPAKPQVKFEEAFDLWLRNQNKEYRHESNIRSPIVTYIVPALGKKSVADITPQQVYDALMTMHQKSGQPFWGIEIGKRTAYNLAAVFNFSIAKGWRENPINPADIKHLTLVGPKPKPPSKEHFPACPYERVSEFWERLTAYTDIPSMGLRWLILHAARAGEVRKLQWDWIDTENRVVTIPAIVMKSGREHKIPYGDAAAELLDTMRAVRIGDLVFGNDGRMLSRNIFVDRTKQLMPDIPGITAHGFRSSFSTWVTETTTFETEMREVALAHQVGDKVAQAYQRGAMLAKRRTMMETWAAYCQGKGIDRKFRSEFVVVAA